MNKDSEKIQEKYKTQEKLSIIKRLRQIPIWTKIFIGFFFYSVGIMLFTEKNKLLVFPTICFLLLLYFGVKKIFSKKTMLIQCPNCKYEGRGEYTTRGSFWIELILWLCFIIPGLIYSIWRLTTKGYACPQCGFGFVIKKGNFA